MGSHPAAQTWTGAFHLAGVHGVLDRDPEGTAGDGVTSVGDVDVIVPRGEGDVLHTAAAVFVVLAGYFGL